jgi:8-oxo-dGTP diphosphatase
LLIKRRDVPVWVLPGGGIEQGESPEQAVVREILEETGFTVKIDRLVGDYLPINKLTKRTYLYECKVLSGEPILTEETGGISFFPLNQLPLMPPPYPEWIQDGCNQKVPVRKHLHSVNYLTLCKYLFLHPVLVVRFILARCGLSINS